MRSFLVGVLALCIGCAPSLSAVRQGVTAAEKVVAAASQSLDQANQKKYQDDLERFKTDPQGAVADYDKWVKIYESVQKAIDDAHATIKTIANALPLAELGISKSKDAGAWMAQLAKTVGDLLSLMAAFGLNTGGAQ